jgi:cytochrome c
MKNRIGAVWALGVSFVAGCGGASATGAPSTTGASALPPATFQEQAAEGQKLYAAHCASCHGAGGEGKDAPRLVGLSNGALPLDPAPKSARKMKFRTAADVQAFIARAMPPGEEGRLSAEQYWDIVAFDMKANGVTLEKRLDPESAAAVAIHP